jgi:hypothetical protein
MKTAFEEPSPEENTDKKSGLKVNNLKSRFQPKQDSQKDFDKKVKEFVSEKSERNKKALELGQKFLSMLNDKMLNSNKSLIQKDLEKQICNDLFSLATAVNNDPSESEGAGSLVLDTLFFKSLLIMRDRLNEIEYSLNSSKKEP